MAFPGTYNFDYYRGDTNRFAITPRTSSGQTFDLQSYTAQYTIATERGATGTQYQQTATINPQTNVVECTITPDNGRLLTAGTYVYDVQVSTGESPSNTIYTLLTGTITVTDDITGAA